MKIRPLVSWAGGKTRHLKRLLPYIPKGKGTGYIEVFAGGCALLLAKEKSTLEVVNDINGDLINLYRVAQAHPEELCRIIKGLPPASRDQVLHSRRVLESPQTCTDIVRAAHFIHLNKTSFAGIGSTLAIVVNPASKAWIGTEKIIERIAQFHARFDSVVVENQSYEKILNTYDHPENFFFLDPPYGGKTAGNYAAWGKEQLVEFRERVGALDGKWIITLDDSLLNRHLWAGFDIEYLSTRSGAGNQKANPGMKFGEMIIYSPGLREEAHNTQQVA